MKAFAAGKYSPGKVKGFAINGLISNMTVAKGVYLTGLYNNLDEFHGLVFATIGNKSIKGKGVQIGLINKCKHLKGFQIGRWNENSKRKFPIINWDFN